MTFQFALHRRQFLLGATSLAGLGLAGCATLPERADATPPLGADVLSMYAAMPDEAFPIPAARIDLLDPKYYRQVVPYTTSEQPGTIIVDTPNRFLYLVRADSQAMRYGVGIGREGFAWQGRAVIAYKKQWPTWTPPSEMIDRQPELEQYRHGMAPGLDNPLGPRALYIFRTARTLCIGCMATWTPVRSARLSRVDACGCSFRMSSISTSACRMGRPSSSCNSADGSRTTGFHSRDHE